MNEPVDRIPEKVELVDIESIPVNPTVTTVEVESTQAESGENSQEKVRIEEFTITGDVLVAKVKEWIHQGNIRRIIIKNEEGRPLIEVPLTVGVVGGVIGATLFPVIAALGAIGALVTHLKVVIERRE
ncbi:MAG TPA: DUF4342 domain-containing protein [Chroococcales cyanobacterium]